MALATLEQKARRMAGMERAKQEMTTAQRIHRALTNGRPPMSEMKSPTAALGAARVLVSRIRAELKGLDPEAFKCGVVVAYISTDLTVLGYTVPFTEASQPRMLSALEGSIPIGLLFGILDPDATDEAQRVLVGARPFLSTKQVDEWLSSLLPALPEDILDPA
jgi:hypothetical protein